MKKVLVPFTDPDSAERALRRAQPRRARVSERSPTGRQKRSATGMPTTCMWSLSIPRSAGW